VVEGRRTFGVVFLAVILTPLRGSMAVIRPMCQKVYMASAYLRVSTTEFGMS